MRKTVKLNGYYFCCAICAAFLLMAFTSRTSNAQTSKRITVSATDSIVAGQSVGKMKIGDTVDRIFQLYPKLKRSEYYQSKECSAGELTLPDSLTLYFQNGRVSQISVQSNYSKTTPETAEKVKPGNTPEQIKKSYPGATNAYTKLDSAATSTGYAPLIYWVDYKAGIGFEFYTDSSRGRLVDKIHVFAPNGKMQFGSLCDMNEDLRELPSFATKIPEKMIRDSQK